MSLSCRTILLIQMHKLCRLKAFVIAYQLKSGPSLAHSLSVSLFQSLSQPLLSQLAFM